MSVTFIVKINIYPRHLWTNVLNITTFRGHNKVGHKTKRILYIYKKLLSNNRVNVKHMSKYFNTNERTIQRDIEDIKTFLSEQNQTILHEKSTNNYYITHNHYRNNDEININVTFEMNYDIYRQLKNNMKHLQYRKKSKTITVVLSIPKSIAIDICFYYRKSIRLVSPETLVDDFVYELSKLQRNYILNKL